MSGGGDNRALRAWASAVADWAGGPEFPPALSPAAFGLDRPGGPVQQLPWGPGALPALASPAALSPYLDHTLLRPDALADEVEQLAAEAQTFAFGGACVHPVHVRRLAQALGAAPVLAIAVVGFPSGAHLGDVKALEVRLAVADGARELDAVAALGPLRTGDVEAALADMQALVAAAGPRPVKLILETGVLARRAVALGAGLALVAGCAAVKTSTGFAPVGARLEDVALLRAVVGPALAVKASGGVRTRAQALALIAAGASRLGTSASVALVSPEAVQ